jgi:MFS family permease
MQLRQRWARVFALATRGPAGTDTPVLRRNIQLLYWDIAWFGVLFGVTANFLVIFVARLNASPWLLSAVTSGPALVNVLWQLQAARIVERNDNPQRLTMRATLPNRIGFLVIALIPLLLPFSWQAYAIVAVILLQGIPTAIMFVAFQTMFTDMVPRARMAAVVGTRNALLGLTSTIMVMVCGVVLTVLPFPWGYQALFLIGFAGSLGSLWSIANLQIPRTAAQPGAVTPLTPVAPAPALLRDRNFVRFSLGAGMLNLGMFMTAPLFPLYWVDRLGLSDGWISIFATTLSMASILGAFGLRTVSHRWRIPTFLATASLLFALHPILTSMLVNPLLLAAVAAFAGIWGGVINVMLFNGLAEVCPPSYRPRYIGGYTWLMNIAMFAGPLIGAGLAEVAGVQVALVTAGLIRIVSAVLFLRLPFVAWDHKAEPVVVSSSS